MDQFFNADTFETESVSLPSYHWLEGVYQCQLSPNMSGVLAITNLLNQSAIPIYGYASQEEMSDYRSVGIFDLDVALRATQWIELI